MNLQETIILCTGLTVSLSLFFGFLPMCFSTACAITDPRDPGYTKASKKAKILAFLLNFGGGVLLANCFCHWLPEVREGNGKKVCQNTLGKIHLLSLSSPGFDAADVDSVLPLAEIIMCIGFFFICFLEVIIHSLLTPHGKSKSKSGGNDDDDGNKSIPIQTVIRNGDTAPTAETEFQRYDSMQERCPVNSDHEAPSLEACRQQQLSKLDDGDEEDEEDAKEKEKDRVSAIRTFFVVSALSFHSVIEGLTLGLSDEKSGVWLNFEALAMHKFVIAFSVGVELVSAKVRAIGMAGFVLV